MIPSYIKTIEPTAPRIEDVPVGGFWPVVLGVSKFPGRIHVSQILPTGQRWSIRVRTEPEPNSSADACNYTQTGNEVHFDMPDMATRPPAIARVMLCKRQS